MSWGSQTRGMKIIPLTPPFSKGEISFLPFHKVGNVVPPLEKGGKGGFERLFSSEHLAIYRAVVV